MRKCSPTLGKLTIIIALSVVPGVAHAGISGFGDFSNFTVNKSLSDSGPSPNIFPGKIELTDNAGLETRSIFYNVPQSISTFTASFTYQEVNGNSPSSQFVTQGATFILQNTSAGAQAVAAGSGAFGFQELGGLTETRSAGLSLELDNPTATTLYTQAAVTRGGANATSPVNLLSGDAINVSLSYNGSTLHETLTDSITSATASFSYLINLPQLLGGTNAYVGFGAQTPSASSGFVPDQQYFSDFQFNAVPEPASLVLLLIGMSFLVANQCLRRRWKR